MNQWNNDRYTKKARNENYAARSIYKLEEIDSREKILRGALSIVDLGASPGSWTQYCLKKLNAKGRVIAIDPSPIQPSDPRLLKIEKQIQEVDWETIKPDGGFDLVLSDMAPKTTGVHSTDVARSLELAELALEVARAHLKKGGHFVVKVFMGDDFDGYRKSVQTIFKDLRIIRPDSTRKQSREVFLVGKYKKGMELL